MKKHIKTYFTLIGCVLILLYVQRGYLRGKVGYAEEKHKLISGKVVRVYKPPTEKIIHIVFADSSEYSPSFFGLNYVVEAGDSLIKPPDSYRFIIYKKGNVNDSIIFQGANSFYDPTTP